MRNFKTLLVATVLAACALGAGVAQAVQPFYGYDPISGVNGLHGTLTSGQDNVPTLTGCATISASTVTNMAGHFATSGTSCNLVITFPTAAPNGYYCTTIDVTHNTDYVVMASQTTKAVTFAGTTSASDVIYWSCFAF